MKYIKVRWLHNHTDDPILIFTEIDDDLWEHRKVEFFRNKQKGYADKTIEYGGSMLSLEPWPSLVELKADPEFEVNEISPTEFNEVWSLRNEFWDGE